MSEQLEFKQRPKFFGLLVTLLNHIGVLFLGRAQARPIPTAPGKILVGKCDHLGDLLMITGFLMALRKRFPSAKITLLHGAWGRGLAACFLQARMVDGLIQYSPFVLNRLAESPFRKIRRAVSEFFSALRAIKAGAYELYFDLRPFSGNTLLLARLAKVPCRVGFGGREFGFTLNYRNPYQENATLGQMINNFSVFWGAPPIRYEGPEVPATFWDGMPPEKPSNDFYVLVHAISGNPRKNLSCRDWSKVLSLLDEAGIFSVWVGSKADQSELEKILSSSEGKHRMVCGDLKATLAECLRADAALTVDSFVAHAVLAAKKPLMVLGPASLRTIVFQAIPREKAAYVEIEGDFTGKIASFLEEKRKR